MKETRQGNFLIQVYGLLYSRFGPRHWWPGDTRLEIILGAILTQNTAWNNVEKAIKNLKETGFLNAKRLSAAPHRKLARLIRPAGYYNIKSQRIKNFLRYLNAEHSGSISRMFRRDTHELREELLKIKGIGPETADSILLYAGRRPVFVVDAYTKRIFSRHGFSSGNAGYEELQELFSKNLSPNAKLFNEFHALIVELGKTLCRSSKPLCNICPIRGVKYA